MTIEWFPVDKRNTSHLSNIDSISYLYKFFHYHGEGGHHLQHPEHCQYPPLPVLGGVIMSNIKHAGKYTVTSAGLAGPVRVSCIKTKQRAAGRISHQGFPSIVDKHKHVGDDTNEECVYSEVHVWHGYALP